MIKFGPNYYSKTEHIMVLEFNLRKFRWELWCNNYYCAHGPNEAGFPHEFKWWQIRQAWHAYKNY